MSNAIEDFLDQLIWEKRLKLLSGAIEKIPTRNFTRKDLVTED